MGSKGRWLSKSTSLLAIRICFWIPAWNWSPFQDSFSMENYSSWRPWDLLQFLMLVSQTTPTHNTLHLCWRNHSTRNITLYWSGLKETSSIASTLERTEERHWPARLYASLTTLPSLSQSKRQGNCFLSCLFKSFGTIVSSFERSETSPVFLALLVHHALASSEGCGLQVRFVSACSYILIAATVQGTDQEHHASFKKKILRSKPEIYEYLSWDADTALK